MVHTLPFPPWVHSAREREDSTEKAVLFPHSAAGFRHLRGKFVFYNVGFGFQALCLRARVLHAAICRGTKNLFFCCVSGSELMGSGAGFHVRGIQIKG